MSQILLYGMLLILPLIGGAAGLVFKSRSSWVATLFVFAGLILSILGFFEPEPNFGWNWVKTIDLIFRIDRTSSLLIFLVYLISFLVHVFSMYYMQEDERQSNYYFKLGFFTASMLGLLASDSLLLFFAFWELVGFSSYLLIGFWFSDSEKARAAKESFMINRIADAFLFIGIILLMSVFDVKTFSEMQVVDKVPAALGFFLVIGAFGKSAQFPFSGWLKKAMAGPTPVSALIHAATMVTAGVYLLIRIYGILPVDILLLVSLIGAITAFMAAVSAVTQYDIKSVLAYSTISQLGYMVMAIGTGSIEASLFHLWTHAFFKAGLFLAAGSVIHFMHQVSDSNPQDMRNMGGLRKFLPITFITFLLCSAALAGLPFFSGFLSKEGILTHLMAQAIQKGGTYLLVAGFAFVTALLTPYYIARQVLWVFFGESRSQLQTHHEPIWTLKFPLLFLGLASLWIFHSFIPWDSQGWWLSDFVGLSSYGGHAYGTLTLVLSVGLTLIGLAFAYRNFGPNTEWISVTNSSGFFTKISLEGWYLERLYQRIGNGFVKVSKFAAVFDGKVIDTFVNGVGIFVVVVAKLVGWFDRYLVDGMVNVIASVARFFGKLLARIQAPMVQFQVLFAVLIVILVLLWTQGL